MVITSEYDIFRNEAYNFAEKLKKSSKLLDFSDYASVGHGFDESAPKSIINDQWAKDAKALV